jgi:Flp pilus assembly protein TadG
MTSIVKKVASLAASFCRAEDGSYAIIAAVAMPVFVGLCGLGIETALWMYDQSEMQGAADSGAVSAATADSTIVSDLVTQAKAVTASYGFVDGTDGTIITVNRPPLSGAYVTTSRAVEVTVQQPQSRLFTSIYSSSPVNIGARAVAIPAPGLGCVLALDKAASGAAAFKGSAAVALNKCSLYSNSANAVSVSAGGTSSLSTHSVRASGGVSGASNIDAEHGIYQNQSPALDPYASFSSGSASGCTQTNLRVKTNMTISAGTYCGGIQVNAGAVLTLNPGIYYITGGDFTVNGGATVTGSGVTLVFTSQTGTNYATANINGGATVNLTAPTSGPTTGIVLFGDRNMPMGTSFKLNGGSTQYFGGAVYLPKAALEFAGGADSTTSCTQIVADTITFTGNAILSLDCIGDGVKPIGSEAAILVE